MAEVKVVRALGKHHNVHVSYRCKDINTLNSGNIKDVIV